LKKSATILLSIVLFFLPIGNYQTATAAAWHIKFSSSNKSGNLATAIAIATYQNGIMSRDYFKSVTIECGKNGFVS